MQLSVSIYVIVYTKLVKLHVVASVMLSYCLCVNYTLNDLDPLKLMKLHILLLPYYVYFVIVMLTFSNESL